MATPFIEKYGAKPANIQWTVVRGDTGILQVQFYENDESTSFDTTGWTYKATAYDPSGDLLDDLTVVPDDGYVTIKASPTLTDKWGSKFRTIVSELRFDLRVTIPEEDEDVVWTPVIGKIVVLGNVTPSDTL
jgi:hypothetical protein